jgi:predicted phosphodiesterase
MPGFRLLQMSDLHFHRTPRTVGLPDNLHLLTEKPWLFPRHFGTVSGHDPDVALAAAAFAWVNRAGLDAVILTGDLATTGDKVDLQQAYDFLHAPPGHPAFQSATRRATLAGVQKPLLLLPGNHDRFGPVRRMYPPGDRNFDRLFGDYWYAGQGVQRLWESAQENIAVVLVGADFTLPRNDTGNHWLTGHLGCGRVRSHLVDTLLEETAQARQRYPGNCAVLWAIHFEPLAQDRTLALLEDQILLDKLAAAPETRRPLAVLCGHTHRNSQIKPYPPTHLVTCGTTCQYYCPGHPNSLNVIEIQMVLGQRTLTLRPFRYDPLARPLPFVPQPSQQIIW